MSSELSPPSGFKQLPSVLNSREAARALRIGVKELRQLIERGDLAAARIGPRRVIRIAKSALLDVLRGPKRAE
jgi:excisionase family DNA binding protein